MIKKIIKDKRGVALYITLSILVVIVTIITVLGRTLLNGVDMATNQKRFLQARYVAESAIEQTKWMAKNTEPYGSGHTFFSGCSVGQCINFTSGGCIACGNAQALTNTTTIDYYFYRAQVVVNAKNSSGATLEAQAFDTNRLMVYATTSASLVPRCFNDDGSMFCNTTTQPGSPNTIIPNGFGGYCNDCVGGNDVNCNAAPAVHKCN